MYELRYVISVEELQSAWRQGILTYGEYLDMLVFLRLGGGR